MLTDWELWACAHQVCEQHGEQAPVFIAERIGACALAADAAGVATWKAIADRFHHLAGLSEVPPRANC